MIFLNSKPGHIPNQMSAMFFQNLINTFILSDCFLIIRLCFCQRLCAVQVVSPTISSPVCQEQLVEAGKLVDRSVETCVNACRSASGDGELLKQVGAAAGMVSQALSDLLQHVRHYASCGEPIGRYDQATDTIMNVTENIVTSMGDAGEIK